MPDPCIGGLLIERLQPSGAAATVTFSTPEQLFQSRGAFRDSALLPQELIGFAAQPATVRYPQTGSRHARPPVRISAAAVPAPARQSNTSHVPCAPGAPPG